MFIDLDSIYGNLQEAYRVNDIHSFREIKSKYLIHLIDKLNETQTDNHLLTSKEKQNDNVQKSYLSKLAQRFSLNEEMPKHPCLNNPLCSRFYKYLNMKKEDFPDIITEIIFKEDSKPIGYIFVKNSVNDIMKKINQARNT